MRIFDENINLEINPVNALMQQLLLSRIIFWYTQIGIAASFVNSRRSWMAAK